MFKSTYLDFTHTWQIYYEIQEQAIPHSFSDNPKILPDTGPLLL
jgi:hypothetical protein